MQTLTKISIMYMSWRPQNSKQVSDSVQNINIELSTVSKYVWYTNERLKTCR